MLRYEPNKIADFGVSKIVGASEILYDQCGTPAYIAPEVMVGTGYKPFSSDIWSCGIVLYILLYGTVPFKADCMTDLKDMIINGKYEIKNIISIGIIITKKLRISLKQF
jgi:serine/threonine protein kinase